MTRATRHTLTAWIAGAGLSALGTAAMADQWMSPLESASEPGRIMLNVPSPEQLPERPLAPLDIGAPIRRPLTVGDLIIQSGADLTQEELEPFLDRWSDQPLSFAELQQVAAELVVFLQGSGHPLAEIELLPGGRLSEPFEGLRLSGLTEPPLDQEPTIRVESVAVEGMTILDDATVAAVLEPWEARDLTLAQLGQASGDLTAAMRDEGFLLAEAFVPAQEVVDGRVLMQVREGVVDPTSGSDGITVEGADNRRVRPEVVADYLAKGIEPGAPLQADPLERAVSVLDQVPGLADVRVDLAPGSEPGSTQLIAQVTEESLFSGQIQFDNLGSRFTGDRRSGLSLGLNSPLGYGSRVALDGVVTDQTERGNFAVDVPVNRRGWRSGLSLSLLNSELEFDEVSETERVSPDLQSRLRELSLFTSYPLISSPRNNVLVSASLGQTRFERNFESFDAGLDRDARINRGSITLSGDRLDDRQGQNRWSVSVTHGDLDLSRQPEDEEFDALTADTAGAFTRVNASAGRLQSIQALPGNNWSLWTSVRGQWANRNLDPGEKFQLGGPFGVRAYPVGEAQGDHGWLATAELRKLLVNRDQFRTSGFLFYDIGGIEQFAEPSELLLGDQPNSYRLRGYGVGLSFAVSEHLDLRLIGARKAGTNPNPNPDGTDADGRERDTRAWVIGTLNF